MGKIVTTIFLLFVSMRPRQWLKNFSVFAAIFFGGRFLNLTDLSLVSFTFLIFCLLSSSMYLFNDLIDSQADQFHFSKKNRPIAKGLISRNLVLFSSALLGFLGILLAFSISELLLLTTLVFLTTQLSYSLYLKRFIIIDIMAIAFSFMLRVFAGSFVIQAPLSSWLILTVMMLSIFLAIGKRRSEVTLLNSQQAVAHRQILSNYPVNFLDGLTFMMAVASLLTYSLFTFNSPRVEPTSFISSFLPSTLESPRWLMVTIPIVAYGIFRYLYLIFEKKEGESPERVLLTDQPLFTTVALWILLSFIFTYIFSG